MAQHSHSHRPSLRCFLVVHMGSLAEVSMLQQPLVEYTCSVGGDSHRQDRFADLADRVAGDIPGCIVVKEYNPLLAAAEEEGRRWSLDSMPLEAAADILLERQACLDSAENKAVAEEDSFPASRHKSQVHALLHSLRRSQHPHVHI